MTARYLIRLDDACATMASGRWLAVERMLDRLGVAAIVAVVPDNRDLTLVFDAPDPHFWQRVHSWEAKGWTIAMHGLHHAYHAIDRRRLVLPFHDRSEFAGLDLAAQTAKIAASWSLFVAEGIRPTAWIAPGHAFDRDTVRAIAQATPIRIINDGLAIEPFMEDGFRWIPQQLWGPARRARGVWTICLHPNMMSEDEIDRLEKILTRPYYRSRLASLGDIAPPTRPRSFADHAYRRWFMADHHVRPWLLSARDAGRRLMRPRTA